MLLGELVSRLQDLKGSGAWRDIAKSAGVDYFTVARIARGDMPNPGIKTCERIVDAIERLSPAKPPDPSHPDAEPAGERAIAAAELHTQSEADHATCGAAQHPNTPRGTGRDPRHERRHGPCDPREGY